MTTSLLKSSSGSYQHQDAIHIDTTDSGWQLLYRTGGAAALLMAAFIPIQSFVFFVWPPPRSVTGWFALFQQNALVGLLDMDLLMIVDYVLLALIFLALYATLRHTAASLMAIVLALQLVAVTTYFASTVAFEMLTLSNQYTAATTEAERATFIAAGQAMLATWQGTAFDVSYILSAIATLLVSIVMLRSRIFGRVTAWMGIALSILMFAPPTAGMVGLYCSLLSLVPLVIWDILVARRLFQFGHGVETGTEPGHARIAA